MYTVWTNLNILNVYMKEILHKADKNPATLLNSSTLN